MMKTTNAKPRFDVYRAVSAQIHAVFAEHSDLIEPLSLDEAYPDATEYNQNIAVATEMATIIRARIKEVTGLNKPNGQAVITPKAGPDFVANLPVKKCHGVGPATATKMERLGIETGGGPRAKSLSFLQQHYGNSGNWYYRISQVIDERPVKPNRRHVAACNIRGGKHSAQFA